MKTANDLVLLLGVSTVIGILLLIIRLKIKDRAELYRFAWNWRSGKLVRKNYCRSARTAFIEYSPGEVVQGIDRFNEPVSVLKQGKRPTFINVDYIHYYEQ